MRCKKAWFSRMGEAYMVLWWVPAGHIPSVEEAAQKLNTLRKHGPTAEVFLFKKAFPAPSEFASGPTGILDGKSSAT